MERVLVTGAAGRLGRATLEVLAAQGIAVTALDLRDAGDLPADRVVVGAAGDPETVRKALSDVDAVVHCAALPAPTLGTPKQVFCGNTEATFVVLEEAGQAGVTRAVVASSMSVLGLAWAARELRPPYLPMDEDIPLQIEDPYALGKQVDEMIGTMMARRHAMTVVALRFPMLGGIEERLVGVARRWADDPAEAATSVWAYLDDRDAARANWLSLVAPLTGYHTVMVAAPETLAARPTEELLDRYLPEVPRRAAFPGWTVPMDLSRAERLLGFRAEHLFPRERIPG